MSAGNRSISVIGASGFVGSSLYESLQTSLGNRYRITGTCNTCRNNDELVPLDITDSKALERYLVTSDPAFVILAAGTKDVKKCEQDPGYAYRLNTAPVVAAAEIIVRRRLDARLLFLSTDYVFDGTRGCYRDIDAPAPGTIYGKSKMLAEQSLLASGIEGKIVRTSAVMGKGGTFFDWLVNELRTKEEVRMFDNIYFSPTPINLLDDMITELLLGYESIDRKILHVNGEKRLSRLEFGSMVRDCLGLDTQIVPEHAESSTMQHDLSMIPSEPVARWRRLSFEGYMRTYLNAGV